MLATILGDSPYDDLFGALGGVAGTAKKSEVVNIYVVRSYFPSIEFDFKYSKLK